MAKMKRFLRISTVDSTGMELMDAQLPFIITVKGDAFVTEIDGSLPELVSKSDTMTVWKSKLENGIKKLKLKAGKTSGIINVEVKTEGLWPASHEIHTIPGEVVLLSPKPEQIKSSPNISQK